MINAASFTPVLPGLLITAWAGPALFASAYRTGPPPGYSGGSGDASCHYCHYEFEPGPPGGTLDVIGFPEIFEPGIAYPIEVVLRHEVMGAAGYQLAVRHATGDKAGSSAGDLKAEDARSAVVTDGRRDVAYAQHNLEGTTIQEPGEARWRLTWTAPVAGAGPLVLAVAANAADGDESQMGDRVYTLTLPARPAPPAPAFVR